MISRKVKKLKFVIIPLCLITAIILLYITMSKYESSSTSTANIEVAFYILDTDYKSMNINLSSINPRVEPYIYTFTISNNDGKNRTQTALEYDLDIKTTTNLPLSFELYMNENYNDTNATNIITKDNVEQDEYGTYFRKISTQTKQFGFKKNETNTYYLVVYFPEIYKSIEYQDIIEAVQINVNSKQILE